MNKSYNYLFKPMLFKLCSSNEKDAFEKLKIINTYIYDKTKSDEFSHLTRKIFIRVRANKDLTNAVDTLRTYDKYVTHYHLKDDEYMILIQYPKFYRFTYTRFLNSQYSMMYSGKFTKTKLDSSDFSKIFNPINSFFARVLSNDVNYFRNMMKGLTQDEQVKLLKQEFDVPWNKEKETYG